MAKVTMNKAKMAEAGSSPSAEIIRDANKTYSVYDELGRQLIVKLPSFQDNMRYDLYFGKFDESNKKFYDSNKFILFIKEIDSVPIAFPTTEAEALALASRLGNEGFAAIMNCIAEHFPLDDVSSDQADSEVKSTLKK